MSRSKEIVKDILLVILWVTVIYVLVTLLTGCLKLTRDERLDEGSFRVQADCEKNTVEVELDLDRTDDRKGVTK